MATKIKTPYTNRRRNFLQAAAAAGMGAAMFGLHPQMVARACGRNGAIR